MLERKESQREPCTKCGGASVVITIRSGARLTLSVCPRCASRAWAIDGGPASLADVLGVLARQQPHPVPRVAPANSGTNRCDRVGPLVHGWRG